MDVACTRLSTFPASKDTNYFAKTARGGFYYPMDPVHSLHTGKHPFWRSSLNRSDCNVESTPDWFVTRTNALCYIPKSEKLICQILLTSSSLLLVALCFKPFFLLQSEFHGESVCKSAPFPPWTVLGGKHHCVIALSFLSRHSSLTRGLFEQCNRVLLIERSRESHSMDGTAAARALLVWNAIYADYVCGQIYCAIDSCC